jgi:large subunit ribosomal protein L16
MLTPKRRKFRKSFKHTIKGLDQKSALSFGSFGLKAMEGSRITARQIESARRAITRKMKREGRVWIQVFPHVPVTAKPTEVRMGKGKGSVSYWAIPVKPGKVIFEVDGISIELAKQALKFGAGKLPIKTKFIEKKNHD